MITAEVYSDIQIVQGANFTRDIEFDLVDVDEHDWYGTIAKDNKGTSFAHGSTTVTKINFTIVKLDADSTNSSITISLTPTQTRGFSDDFEGVWDLYSAPDADTAKRVRQVQGDVVVSPSVGLSDATFTNLS